MADVKEAKGNLGTESEDNESINVPSCWSPLFNRTSIVKEGSFIYHGQGPTSEDYLAGNPNQFIPGMAIRLLYIVGLT